MFILRIIGHEANVCYNGSRLLIKLTITHLFHQYRGQCRGYLNLACKRPDERKGPVTDDYLKYCLKSFFPTHSNILSFFKPYRSQAKK